MNKKNVVKEIEEWDDDDLEGSLDIVIEKLQGVKNKYPDYCNFYTEKDYTGERTYYLLYGTREETDKEFRIRKKEEDIKKDAVKKMNEAVVEQEKKTLKLLYKKYGKDELE